MYVMLAGYHPLDIYGDASEATMMTRIKVVDYNFDDEIWDDMTEDPMKIISQLLVLDESKRMSLSEFLLQGWVNGKVSQKYQKKYKVQRMNTINNMQQFNGARQGFMTAINTGICAKKMIRAWSSRKLGANQDISRTAVVPEGDEEEDVYCRTSSLLRNTMANT